MKFTWFHLMPWPHMPYDFRQKHRSVWVDLPSRMYEPELGHGIYHQYLDQLEFAESVGFDGIGVNEHHANAYGLMPSPNIMAATLTRRTSKAALVVLGNSIALYNPPIRVAEEFAMLDVLSGGRLVAGMVIGGGPEYFTYNIDPTTGRERFREALELILKAWTTPGPFVWNSKHYFFRYVNPWPRPIQQPHPPIWIPGAGSRETIDLVAKKRFSYMGIPYFHIDVFRRVFDQFREACTKPSDVVNSGMAAVAVMTGSILRTGSSGVSAAPAQSTSCASGSIADAARSSTDTPFCLVILPTKMT